MENASKALLTAAGVLLTMLIIGLILFARGRFGQFFINEDSLKDTVDISEFNLQFTNFNRDDVHGYELISLANKVADYNMRFSSAQDAKNDQKYTPITLTIRFPEPTAQLLWYDTEVDTHFFKNNQTITQNLTLNQILNIFTEAIGNEGVFGSANEAARVAKNINAFSDRQRDYYIKARNISKEEAEKIILDDYNSVVSTEEAKASNYAEIKTKLTKIANIYKYYEYYQFKKGIFKCINVDYDSASSRVKKIDFEFTGKFD